MNAYRKRILKHISSLLTGRAPAKRALDFGCGDGWFGSELKCLALAEQVVGVDVGRRDRCLIDPIIYSGQHLPFADGEFDLVYAIDVLHHCREPVDALLELIRCSSKLVLIKDHNYQTALGAAALFALDELGNRRFGIPCPGNYQSGWRWLPVLESSGFHRVGFCHPTRCHTGPLGALTNHLQFIGLWER